MVHPKKKLSRGCIRVRPDANTDADADANRSKTICRPPLKGGGHNHFVNNTLIYSHYYFHRKLQQRCRSNPKRLKKLKALLPEAYNYALKHTIEVMMVLVLSQPNVQQMEKTYKMIRFFFKGTKMFFRKTEKSQIINRAQKMKGYLIQDIDVFT